MRIFLLFSAATAMLLLTAACNTFEGMGQDVEVGGEKIQRAAEKNKGEDSREHGY